MVGLALAIALTPQFALAQEGIGNPFADSSAQQGALNFIDSLVFWVIIGFLLGVVYAAAAYALQGPFPMLWSPIREWGKMAFVMFIIFQVAIQVLRGLAVAAQGKGQSWMDVPQYLGLIIGWW
jgi:hypothetical protein